MRFRPPSRTRSFFFVGVVSSWDRQVAERFLARWEFGRERETCGWFDP